MRIYHLADLHFGKSIYGRSMLEDQRYWTDRFLDYCSANKPDAVVIAGDVYDRSAPSGDAVELLDYFLTELADRDIQVFVIAGNHDSGQRLSFGKSLLAKQKIHIAGTIEKEMTHITVDKPDDYGPVTFWLMPYTFLEQVSSVLGEDDLKTYDQAARAYISKQNIDTSLRNILVGHQNVTANGKEAERRGSESMVGGVGQIDYTAYDSFDYVALGHIHSAYPVGRAEVRYAGTPLCYHMDETRQTNKGFTEVILGKKGDEAQINQISIEPLHKMRHLVGTKDEIYSLLRNDTGMNEYIGILLKGERTTPEMSAYLNGLLGARGSFLMEFLSDYSSNANLSAYAENEAIAQKPIEDLFADHFQEQNEGTPPNDDEYAIMAYVGELVRNHDVKENLDPTLVEKLVNRALNLGGDD